MKKSIVHNKISTNL